MGEFEIESLKRASAPLASASTATTADPLPLCEICHRPVGEIGGREDIDVCWRGLGSDTAVICYRLGYLREQYRAEEANGALVRVSEWLSLRVAGAAKVGGGK